MDHGEIWAEAIEKAKKNPALASYVALIEYQRDVLYPQGERGVRNWLDWVEGQS